MTVTELGPFGGFTESSCHDAQVDAIKSMADSPKAGHGESGRDGDGLEYRRRNRGLMWMFPNPTSVASLSLSVMLSEYSEHCRQIASGTRRTARSRGLVT